MLSRTNMTLSRHFFHVIPYNHYVIPTLYRPENVTKLSRRFVIPMLFRWQFLLFRKKKWLYRTLYRSCYKGPPPLLRVLSQKSIKNIFLDRMHFDIIKHHHELWLFSGTNVMRFVIRELFLLYHLILALSRTSIFF